MSASAGDSIVLPSLSPTPPLASLTVRPKKTGGNVLGFWGFIPMTAQAESLLHRAAVVTVGCATVVLVVLQEAVSRCPRRGKVMVGSDP